MEPLGREVYVEREAQYSPIPAQPLEPIVQPVIQQPVIQQPLVQPLMQRPVVQQPVMQARGVVQPVVGANQAVSETNQVMQGDVQMQSGHKTYMDNQGNLIERDEQVFDDPKLARANVLDRTARIIYFVVGLFEVLLLLRFVFRLLGAGANGLVNLVYNVTGPMVIPLNGIFNDQNLNNTSVLEISTLLAMAVWALLGWGIVKLLYIILEPSVSSRSVYTTSRRRRME